MRRSRLNETVVESGAAACHAAVQEIVAAGERNTPMRHSGERVHGPYAHHKRWRVFHDHANGEREILSFDTEAEAKRRKTELLKEIAGRNVSEAVQAHIVAMRE